MCGGPDMCVVFYERVRLLVICFIHIFLFFVRVGVSKETTKP